MRKFSSPGANFNPAGGFTSTSYYVATEARVNYTTAGNQAFPTVAMQPNGSFVIVWSGNGVGDASGIFARRYTEPTDTAGPMVTDFELPNGTRSAAAAKFHSRCKRWSSISTKRWPPPDRAACSIRTITGCLRMAWCKPAISRRSTTA